MDKAQQISIRTHVVEAVIMDADVRNMRRHDGDRPLAPDVQKFLIIRCVELQNRGAELKPLRPFRPTTTRVLAATGEYGRSGRWIPRLVNRSNLAGGQFEQAVNAALQRGGRNRGVDLHDWGKNYVGSVKPILPQPRSN